MKFFTSRGLLYAALISIIGLIVVYSYLPVGGLALACDELGESAFAPGNLVAYHRPAVSRVLLFFADGHGSAVVEFCRMALREFGFAWLPLTLFLAVAGLASAYKRDRTAFWFLLLIILADLAYSLSYEIAEDKDAYYFAGIYFDRDCSRARYPLVDSICCFKTLADLETVCGCCDRDCLDIGYSVRRESAIQQ